MNSNARARWRLRGFRVATLGLATGLGALLSALAWWSYGRLPEQTRLAVARRTFRIRSAAGVAGWNLGRAEQSLEDLQSRPIMLSGRFVNPEEGIWGFEPYMVFLESYGEPHASTRRCPDRAAWMLDWQLVGEGGVLVERTDDWEASLLRVRLEQAEGTPVDNPRLVGERFEVRKGEQLALRVRLHGDRRREVPCRLMVSPGNEPLGIWTIGASRQWQEYLLVTEIAASDATATATVSLGGVDGEVEFSALGPVRFSFREPDPRPTENVVEYRMNRWGNRDEARELVAPRGALRVVCVGDSFTFGSGVQAEETLPGQLQRRLRERVQTTVEVLNCGVPGTPPANYRDKYLERDVRFDPDIVLVTLTMNDHLSQARLRALREQFGGGQPLFAAMDRAALEEGYRGGLDDLLPLIEECAANGRKVVLMVYQITPADVWNRLSDDAKDWTSEHGIAYLNPAERLAGEGLFGDAARVQEHGDNHPSARVHAVVAEELAAFLAERGWLDGREGNGAADGAGATGTEPASLRSKAGP